MTGTNKRNHLKRSRQVWDRWSGHYGMSERDFEPMRADAIDRLALDQGDAVLEVGCGPGVNFERIRGEIGPSGRLVAIDYSPEMVARALTRIETHGWKNVTVIRADASSIAFESSTFDAAFASLSMSVLPDIETAVGRVHEALVPKGKFIVFDLRPVPSGALRVVNPLLTRFYRWFANWNSDQRVLACLETVFETVEVQRTYAAGAAYTAVAIKAAG